MRRTWPRAVTSSTGHASQKSDYEIALGTLRFAPGETVKTFTILLVNDIFDEDDEIVDLYLSNPTGTGVGLGAITFHSEEHLMSSDQGIAMLRQLYSPFQRNRERIIVMGVRSAELTKYAANSMLATRISFMNEIANLAEAIGADIEEVRRGIGSDPRIGYQFLYAGVGFGGSCFPKDVKALQRSADEAGRPLRLLHAAEEVNEAQKHVLAAKIKKHFAGDLKGKTIALWGLAFKANTDDMREAPSLVLIDDLVREGARVRAYDPAALGEAKKRFAGAKDVAIVDSAAAALEGADALAIVTEWQEFRSPDFTTIKTRLKTPAIYDGRNLYDPAVIRTLDYEYCPIGRKA